MFTDRFSSIYPGIINVDLDLISLEQLTSDYPLFAKMLEMVRSHSVITRGQATITQIYNAITQHADPRVALILAAARDEEAVQIFPTTETVRAFMFGADSRAPSNSYVVYDDQAIFIDGIMRASAALAASILINQLGIIPEQLAHGELIERRALEDIDRIIKIPTLREGMTTAGPQDVPEQSAFFFESKDLALGTNTLKVEIYTSIPLDNYPRWLEVGRYSGNITTDTLVLAISDYINELTLVRQSNVLASPVLGYKERAGLIYIQFSARSRDIAISTEIISLRFTYKNTANVSLGLPFSWGVDELLLSLAPLNSILLTISKGNTSVIYTSEEQPLLAVLWFRDTSDRTGGTLTYRVSTSSYDTASDPIALSEDLDIPYEESYSSAVTLALVNALVEHREQTRLLATFVDNSNQNQDLIGIELTAWTVTNPQTWLILDVLSLPEGVECAVGDRIGPKSPFTSRPKSLKVESVYVKGIMPTFPIGGKEGMLVVKPKESIISRRLKSIRAGQIPQEIINGETNVPYNPLFTPRGFGVYP